MDKDKSNDKDLNDQDEMIDEIIDEIDDEPSEGARLSCLEDALEAGDPEEWNQEIPSLNQARMQSFGAYRAFYDIQPVDEEKKIWRGRPIIEASVQQKFGGTPEALQTGWVFFTREYDDRNDWDRLYHEFWFEDARILGQPFLLVPKEKLLFGYNPPPKGGIVLPGPGIFRGRRGG